MVPDEVELLAVEVGRLLVLVVVEEVTEVLELQVVGAE